MSTVEDHLSLLICQNIFSSENQNAFLRKPDKTIFKNSKISHYITKNHSKIECFSSLGVTSVVQRSKFISKLNNYLNFILTFMLKKVIFCISACK